MQLRRWIALMGVAALAIACQQAADESGEMAETVDTAAEEQAIRDFEDRYEQALAAKDVDALAGSFTEDVVWTSHDGTTINGQDGIREFYRPMVESPDAASMEINPEAMVIAGSGDIGYEYGTYTTTVTPEGGQSSAATFRYVVLYRKDADGQWRIAAGMDTAPLAPSTEGETSEAPATE